MNSETTMVSSDITFIGSGISSSFTILNLLERLRANDLKKEISLTIIEKSDEFHTGIPYGERSGFSVLLITSLKNFLPEPELSKFIAWLNKNKQWLLRDFKNDGGALSVNWLAKHDKKIKNNEWEDLFIPRRFFGCYINEKVKRTLEQAQSQGLISVDYIKSEVVDLDKNSNGFYIKIHNHEPLLSKKVILSVGSLPVRHLWRDENLIEEDNLLFINNPYHPKLETVLERIKEFLKKRSGKVTNALIVGANASGLEMLYKLNDYPESRAGIDHFTMLSTLGLSPDSLVDDIRQKEFEPSHLYSLKSKENITAKAIADAAFKDLDVAEEIHLGAASTVEIISKAFGALFDKLNEQELKKFACLYGNEIGRRQRCAGYHYSKTIDDLKEEDVFVHIAGRFSNLLQNDAQEYAVEYTDTNSGITLIQEKPVHLVINCVGSTNLSQDDIPILLKRMLQKGYCKPNDSNIGFDVNTSLECMDNLHIMGPLLAGNIFEGKAVWHVEHCGRIIWLSNVLSEKLHQYFLDNGTATKRNAADHEVVDISDPYTLQVKSLDDPSEIIKYKKLLKDQWENNMYYSIEHMQYFEKEEETLEYFLFEKNGIPIILMPFVCRQIDSEILEKKYYDVISPYGYSGPLLKDEVEVKDIIAFWKLVDQWYMEHDIVAEFIRFSLNDNHKNYSGNLINTLSNVRGYLLENFEDQWTAFVSKVRNNYRKAVQYDLKFKIFHRNEITNEVINVFNKIYVSTMHRNNADSLYFFSTSYFQNLILSNPNNFSIALAYYEDIPISAELIINHKDTIFAFLGGTNADYFSYRPNDFLRVKIIDWAINNKFKKYVLGGGMKDGDGLYKSKKSLFPKDEDAIFYTGRKIINKDVYDALCIESDPSYTDIPKEEFDNRFFPYYRAK